MNVYIKVPTTPVPKIIEIAFNLYFLKRYKLPINKPNSITRISDSTILPSLVPNSPKPKIDMAAEVMSATTAGLSAESTFCTPVNLRYL